MSFFKLKGKGFTLIELMVVISILAILVTIGVTSYSTIRKNSRDSIRKSDLHTIQNALEQYYGKNEAYASISTLNDAGYFPKGVPKDPKNKTCNYFPTAGFISSTGYKICADLESSDDFCTCSNDQYDCIGTLTREEETCLKNLQ